MENMVRYGIMNDNILENDLLSISGPYGSSKTTFLSGIFDFLMNLVPTEELNIENPVVEFDDYEVN